MWPATKVSLFLLLIWVLKVIVPSLRTLISVWPFAVDVEPVVSLFADSLACRTHIVPRPFFAGAVLAAGAAAAQATSKQRIKRRMSLTSLRDESFCRMEMVPGAAVF